MGGESLDFLGSEYANDVRIVSLAVILSSEGKKSESSKTDASNEQCPHFMKLIVVIFIFTTFPEYSPFRELN